MRLCFKKTLLYPRKYEQRTTGRKLTVALRHDEKIKRRKKRKKEARLQTGDDKLKSLRKCLS